MDESFLRIIAASMQVRIFKDMDFVIKKGQVGRAMFFVQRGSIEVISEDGIRIYAYSQAKRCSMSWSKDRFSERLDSCFPFPEQPLVAAMDVVLSSC